MTFPAITLAAITNLLVSLFVVATMLSIGLGLSVRQILATASRVSLMGRSLLVNIVLIPALAFILVRVLSTDSRLAIGILLMAMAPGAAFGPKLTQIARAHVALSVGLVAVLATLLVITLPATAALILPGETAIDSLGLIRSLVLIEIIPLALGIFVHARWTPLSRKVGPPTTKASTVLFVLVILATIATSWTSIPAVLEPAAVVAALLTMVGSLALGYWLGGPEVRTRRALAITSLARYAGIALFVANTSFPEPAITAMIVVYGLVEVIIGALLAIIWGRERRTGGIEAPCAGEAEEGGTRAA